MWWKKIAVLLFCLVITLGISVARWRVELKQLWLNTTPQHVVIVPGYGAPVVGNNHYEQYIKMVAEYVSNPANAVNVIIFTGSYSTLPDLSEAEAMNSYFNSIVNLSNLQQRGVHVYQERCAIVSWQNMTYSEALLTTQQLQPTKVTIFGDEQRKTKLLSYAQYAFSKTITISDAVSINFIGYTFNSVTPNQLDDVKDLSELVSAYDPKQSNRVLEARIEDWSKRFHYDVARNLVAKGCEQYKGFIR